MRGDNRRLHVELCLCKCVYVHVLHFSLLSDQEISRAYPEKSFSRVSTFSKRNECHPDNNYSLRSLCLAAELCCTSFADTARHNSATCDDCVSGVLRVVSKNNTESEL